MKYREGEEIVDAFRWEASPGEQDPDWLIQLIFEGNVAMHVTAQGKAVVLVTSPEGTFCAKDGDYIIRSQDGTVVLCEPEIFETVYEEVK